MTRSKKNNRRIFLILSLIVVAGLVYFQLGKSYDSNFSDSSSVGEVTFVELSVGERAAVGELTIWLVNATGCSGSSDLPYLFLRIFVPSSAQPVESTVSIGTFDLSIAKRTENITIAGFNDFLYEYDFQARKDCASGKLGAIRNVTLFVRG